MKKRGHRLHRISRHSFSLGFGVSLFAFAFFVAACTMPKKRPMAAVPKVERSTASLENRHAKNIEILNSMPLIKGFEEAEKSESKYADVLTKIFAKIQDEAKSKRAAHPYRGTHAKGSCFEARLNVFSKEEMKTTLRYPEALANRLAQSLFSEPAKFPVIARFANGKGQHNADSVNDVRAISFSIDTHGHEASANGDFRQDFMFNNTPLFATRNIHEFYELLKTARVAQGDLSYIVNPLFISSTLRAKNLLDTFERNDTVSYALENYWSNVPYSYGLKPDGSPAEVVKFKMAPCDGAPTPHAASSEKAADYLQADIARRIQSGGVCFLMQA
ncbi:MAG: catalase, partial [Proteobacteria bacterium]